MKSSSQVLLTISSLLCTATVVLGQGLKQPLYQGCYSAGGTLQDQGSYTFQTSGWCQNLTVVVFNKPVMALTAGSHCWIGDELPPPSDKVDDSKCNTPCNGFPSQKCGGQNFWGAWLTGTEATVPNMPASSSSSSNPSTTSAPSSSNTPTTTKSSQPSTITEAGQTIVVTAPSQSDGSAATQSTSSGPNKAAIAAGVVVGLVAIAALAGGTFLFLRGRKRRAVEEEYRRNAAINGITGKTDSSSSVSDSRLEPSVMMQRRMSDGSIADNQDYSRRILKVTNPDGT
ncbi:MAG: hypothetical protein M1838_005164 [Thelocarpon superellum]|nr:MAG: hypothetical protein M1838_005164 [Thelocarpon superellum]